MLTKFRGPSNTFYYRLAKVALSFVPKGMKSSKDLTIKKIKIKTRDNKKISTYFIKPKNVDKCAPVIFYFHGGGFVFKAAPYQYRYAKEYAKQANSIVVFVDYRLAFCSPFNAPLNDCVDAYRYYLKNAEIFGIDKNKIAVAGDSAGGWLAIMTALTSHQENLPTPKCQMLIYPVIDNRSQTPSMQKFVDTPVWDSCLNKKMWKTYLQGNTLPNILDYDDLSFMPSTYIELAQFDCLRDEAILLRKSLQKSGVNVITHDTQQTIHGYDLFSKSKITQDSLAKRYAFLSQELQD